jgi:hypothetical protein
MRAALHYGENFKTHFVKGSLPTIFDMKLLISGLEFDNQPGVAITAPEVWEQSALDGRELQSDITENESPEKGSRLIKRKRVA